MLDHAIKCRFVIVLKIHPCYNYDIIGRIKKEKTDHISSRKWAKVWNIRKKY